MNPSFPTKKNSVHFFLERERVNSKALIFDFLSLFFPPEFVSSLVSVLFFLNFIHMILFDQFTTLKSITATCETSFVEEAACGDFSSFNPDCTTVFYSFGK